MDNVGELNVLTNIFIREKKEAGQSESEEVMWQWMQRPEKERETNRDRNRERGLLTDLKILLCLLWRQKKGPLAKEYRWSLEGGKKQENGFSSRSYRKNSDCQYLDFCPTRLILDFWTLECKRVHLFLRDQVNGNLL